ncbi:helix-turn-helix domain-containing protein [Eubacteriales bacterium OttesenSCG-928-K08]|nr:helix-turn-helix domain-containing protein [Eubacteriales bacterium OttesenSCG-928-K08]MDL2288611.1 helix-turn-helix domain-containing protein [Oscillospiraceae bacterium OttesenSCG-928-F05]MDL2300086.1 helix-turn-helix domain-containing protein [Clostridiaceae bacterium OttesenSCG-928-D20]
MDCSKIGRLIAQLRKEKGLTQQNIANALNISNKTVSKWECGLGCPDVSLWADLSVILGADMAQMMEGEITLNRPDSGNINKINFYVCPACKNVLVGTGSSSIFCCGRKLERLATNQDESTPHITTEIIDVDYYITIDHEMTREHYILFAAYVKSDIVFLNRLYPEQSPTLRIPQISDGKLYLYCTKHGLAVYSLFIKSMTPLTKQKANGKK